MHWHSHFQVPGDVHCHSHLGLSSCFLHNCWPGQAQDRPSGDSHIPLQLEQNCLVLQNRTKAGIDFSTSNNVYLSDFSRRGRGSFRCFSWKGIGIPLSPGLRTFVLVVSQTLRELKIHTAEQQGVVCLPSSTLRPAVMSLPGLATLTLYRQNCTQKKRKMEPSEICAGFPC